MSNGSTMSFSQNVLYSVRLCMHCLVGLMFQSVQKKLPDASGFKKSVPIHAGMGLINLLDPLLVISTPAYVNNLWMSPLQCGFDPVWMRSFYRATPAPSRDSPPLLRKYHCYAKQITAPWFTRI